MTQQKSLFIDIEALSTLALVQAGLISPVNKLMNVQEAKEVDETKTYKDVPFPFSFILAPKGKRNNETLKSVKEGETVSLMSDGEKVGELIVDEVFEIDPAQRLYNIYGTRDPEHPGVKNTIQRLGKLAVSGEYTVEYPLIDANIKRIDSMVTKTGARNISAMFIAANPLNRAHERIIRETLNNSDLLVLFLRKPFTSEGLHYDIRYNAVIRFIENFLPRNKVVVVPFENSYIFAGYNELILEAVLAKNYGCHQLVVGSNHGGLGLYYDQNRLTSVFDHCKDINIEIKKIDEYVYCDICKTIVSKRTCPHGQHHHVHYHSASIMKLVQSGLIPPPILVRKEVSSNILAALFPDRFKNLQDLHYSLMPGSGLLEQQSEEQLYHKLIELYQTTSLS